MPPAPDGPYDLGCLYIGVNDVRGPEWDARTFAARHAEAVAFLHERCTRVDELFRGEHPAPGWTLDGPVAARRAF